MRAERVELVDKNGKVLAVLGTMKGDEGEEVACLSFLDSGGKRRVILGVNTADGGESGLMLYREGGTLGAYYSEQSLSFYDENGRVLVDLGLDGSLFSAEGEFLSNAPSLILMMRQPGSLAMLTPSGLAGKEGDTSWSVP